MSIGWKTLLPLSLGWLVVIGIYQKARAMAEPGSWLTDDATAIGVVLIYAAIAALVLFLQRRPIDKIITDAKPPVVDPVTAHYPLPVFEDAPAAAGTQRKEELS